MEIREMTIGMSPAVVYGAKSGKVYLFVHGKGGCKEEAASFAEAAVPQGYQVVSVDLPAELNPWTVVPELEQVYAYLNEHWQVTALRASSIGAYFSMLALLDKPLERALFVSPVVNMEQLIGRMMTWAGVSEEQLHTEQEIPTSFGETLSWKYFCYAKDHPLTAWKTSTAILYAEKDALISSEMIDAFAQSHQVALTVYKDGEHWFHTPEQVAAMNRWEAAQVSPGGCFL
jgi:uncharacterized protein